jgi:signal transduction histidine kinase
MINPQLVTMTAEVTSEPQSANEIRLRGPSLLLGRVIWAALCLLCLVVLSFSIYSLYQLVPAPCGGNRASCPNFEYAINELGLSLAGYGIYFVALRGIAGLPYFVISFLIVRNSNALRALLLSSLLVVLATAGTWYQPIWIWALAYLPLWTISLLMGLFIPGIVLTLYTFPDGHFVPSWTRWLAGPIVLLAFFTAVLPKTALDPASWPVPLPQAIVVILVFTALLAPVYRYRRASDSVQRQQLKWFAAGAALIILSFLTDYGIEQIYPLFTHHTLFSIGIPAVLWELGRGTIWCLAQFTFAICIGMAVFRYRLWDIDLLINRTLVYGALTAIVIGIYVIVVGALGAAIQGRGNLLISILATGLVAVLVQPLRDRLQHGVNRMMYGERDDPVTVLSRLGQRLETTLAPNAVLPSLVETVAQTLKLPYVAIQTPDDHQTEQSGADNSSLTIAYGKPQSDVIRLPLVYQSEPIGQLLVAPRAQGEALSPMDRHLLENIAHQAGMAVHAVNLTTDLQRSRQRIITAREEERRRLRRDLHDGLGPNLASQGLKLAAVKQLLEKDPLSAALLLKQVMTQNQSTVEEIRRLVHGLRPPALDELGLVAAICDHVAGMDEGTLQIKIMEPAGGLPPLSAAVEVAAYRIVLEALTNVIRHANAQLCMIRFSIDENDSISMLQIEIQDDGIGLPSTRRAGVGTRSMRERAEEVGGTFALECEVSSGTCVYVRIPLMVV